MKKYLVTILSLVIAFNVYADIDGIYSVVGYEGKDPGSNFTFKSGKVWSNNDEDAETWDVNVESNEDGSYSLINLFGWGEKLNATYYSYDKSIIIPAGQTIYIDDHNYEYKICGLFNDFKTAEDVMNYCDSQTGYIESDCAPLGDIQVDVNSDETKLSLYSPVLVYVATPESPYFIGYSYSIFTSLRLEKSGNVGIKGDMDGDGEISITDVVKICNAVLEDKYSTIADINNDGALTVTDIVAVVNMILEVEE